MSLVVAAQMALLCTPALSLLLSDLALVLGVWARSWGLLLNLLLLLLRLLLLLPFRYGRNSPAVAGVHPRSSLSDLHPCVCYQQKLGVALATVSPSSSSSSGHELPRNPPRPDLMQKHLSNLPLGSFHLHRNVGQQTRHFFAVIQHFIFTHIR